MSPEAVFYVFSFLIGISIGSFLNVVIYRVPEGMSIVSPPSRCPKCGVQLKWYWNVPLIGWLALRGKCAKCRVPISPRYPLVELLTGLIAVGIAYTYGPTLWALFMFVFAAALVAITFIDIDHMIIPNVISIPGVAVGLVGQALIPGGDVVQGLLGVLIGGGGLLAVAGLYYLIRRVEGMGLGDVKLLAMIGAFTGPMAILQTILVGSLFGSVIGIAWLALTKKDDQTPIPFGPFLAFGALTYVYFPDVLLSWLTADIPY